MPSCNIDKTERINRTIIGVILVLAALLGAGKLFFIVVGGLLILSGLVGWCSIPVIMEKLKLK